VTDHKTVDYQRIVDQSRLVVDTRNATAKVRPGRARIISLSGTSASPEPSHAAV
jgi:UDP-N-acetyl-D-glucosamine dehydrogenase